MYFWFYSEHCSLLFAFVGLQACTFIHCIIMQSSFGPVLKSFKVKKHPDDADVGLQALVREAGQVHDGGVILRLDVDVEDSEDCPHELVGSDDSEDEAPKRRRRSPSPSSSEASSADEESNVFFDHLLEKGQGHKAARTQATPTSGFLTVTSGFETLP